MHTSPFPPFDLAQLPTVVVELEAKTTFVTCLITIHDTKHLYYTGTSNSPTLAIKNAIFKVQSYSHLLDCIDDSYVFECKGTGDNILNQGRVRLSEEGTFLYNLETKGIEGKQAAKEKLKKKILYEWIKKAEKMKEWTVKLKVEDMTKVREHRFKFIIQFCQQHHASDFIFSQESSKIEFNLASSISCEENDLKKSVKRTADCIIQEIFQYSGPSIVEIELIDVPYTRDPTDPDPICYWREDKIREHLIKKEPLSSGCYGSVRRCIFQGEPCAIKKIRGCDSDITREFENLLSLNHESIIKVKAYLPRDCFLIIMEYHPQTLKDYCKNNTGPDRLANITKIATGIASAMQHAHSNNIVHRDLKPANLLISAAGKPVVCDFGLSKDTHIAAASTPVGTRHYRAPETYYNGTKTLTMDVWSFGAVLYYMVFDRPPKLSKDLELYPLQSSGTPLDGLIKSCLSEDPADRPSFDTIVSELSGFEFSAAQDNQKKQEDLI
eukprot:TRINITY_DN8441_c0_g1_i2.p1 TRINITY_DN8441_c0_g1~~TRINITY_DN8441_c0_g1_i2.p1  ORF type:complete len:495 (-),score=76.04 TRINITY_DN8441_c0_g1_i2:82-1566(-)